MQRNLQACWSRSTGWAQFVAVISQQQKHALSFSTAPKQSILNKSRENIRKSGKQLGDKAEGVLEKVVNLEVNAPPPSSRPPPKQQKK